MALFLAAGDMPAARRKFREDVLFWLAPIVMPVLLQIRDTPSSSPAWPAHPDLWAAAIQRRHHNGNLGTDDDIHCRLLHVGS